MPRPDRRAATASGRLATAARSSPGDGDPAWPRSAAGTTSDGAGALRAGRRPPAAWRRSSPRRRRAGRAPAARGDGRGTVGACRRASRGRARSADRRRPARSSSRRHGTPSWRATWRATSSAWSKPRSRRRRRLVGAHVTTSTRAAGRHEPVDEQPGEVPGDRPPVAVLEAEQHVADPTGERGGDHDAVGRLRGGAADEREPARATDRGARGVAAGAAGGEDHVTDHDEGVRG